MNSFREVGGDEIVHTKALCHDFYVRENTDLFRVDHFLEDNLMFQSFVHYFPSASSAWVHEEESSAHLPPPPPHLFEMSTF